MGHLNFLNRVFRKSVREDPIKPIIEDGVIINIDTESLEFRKSGCGSCGAQYYDLYFEALLECQHSYEIVWGHFKGYERYCKCYPYKPCPEHGLPNDQDENLLIDISGYNGRINEKQWDFIKIFVDENLAKRINPFLRRKYQNYERYYVTRRNKKITT